MTVKNMRIISYKRFVTFIIILILLCGFAGITLAKFWGAFKPLPADDSFNLNSELSTAVNTSAEHEKLLSSAINSSKIVKTAVPYIGYKGGEKFWKYCGYQGHVDWCACFVSYCVGSNGYIKDGQMEKFAYVPYGVNWFKEKGRWKKAGYEPSSGNLIFFDWDHDGTANHIGIVEYCHDDTVYTIEGNRDDICGEAHYSINSKYIMGYGVIKE